MTTETEIVVGMGATRVVGSDRYPATVVAIKGNRVAIQDDDWQILPGTEYNATPQYVFLRSPNDNVVWYSKRKNGRYHRVGSSSKFTGYVVLGYRSRYFDPHI